MCSDRSLFSHGTWRITDLPQPAASLPVKMEVRYQQVPTGNFYLTGAVPTVTMVKGGLDDRKNECR